MFREQKAVTEVSPVVVMGEGEGLAILISRFSNKARNQGSFRRFVLRKR